MTIQIGERLRIVIDHAVKIERLRIRDATLSASWLQLLYDADTTPMLVKLPYSPLPED
jgi:hypothetical protein